MCALAVREEGGRPGPVATRSAGLWRGEVRGRGADPQTHERLHGVGQGRAEAAGATEPRPAQRGAEQDARSVLEGSEHVGQASVCGGSRTPPAAAPAGSPQLQVPATPQEAAQEDEAGGVGPAPSRPGSGWRCWEWRGLPPASSSTPPAASFGPLPRLAHTRGPGNGDLRSSHARDVAPGCSGGGRGRLCLLSPAHAGGCGAGTVDELPPAPKPQPPWGPPPPAPPPWPPRLTTLPPTPQPQAPTSLPACAGKMPGTGPYEPSQSLSSPGQHGGGGAGQGSPAPSRPPSSWLLQPDIRQQPATGCLHLTTGPTLSPSGIFHPGTHTLGAFLPGHYRAAGALGGLLERGGPARVRAVSECRQDSTEPGRQLRGEPSHISPVRRQQCCILQRLYLWIRAMATDPTVRWMCRFVFVLCVNSYQLIRSSGLA